MNDKTIRKPLRLEPLGALEFVDPATVDVLHQIEALIEDPQQLAERWETLVFG